MRSHWYWGVQDDDGTARTLLLHHWLFALRTTATKNYQPRETHASANAWLIPKPVCSILRPYTCTCFSESSSPVQSSPVQRLLHSQNVPVK